jgi:hypothetical protein
VRGAQIGVGHAEGIVVRQMLRAAHLLDGCAE